MSTTASKLTGDLLPQPRLSPVSQSCSGKLSWALRLHYPLSIQTPASLSLHLRCCTQPCQLNARAPTAVAKGRFRLALLASGLWPTHLHSLTLLTANPTRTARGTRFDPLHRPVDCLRPAPSLRRIGQLFPPGCNDSELSLRKVRPPLLAFSSQIDSRPNSNQIPRHAPLPALCNHRLFQTRLSFSERRPSTWPASTSKIHRTNILAAPSHANEAGFHLRLILSTIEPCRLHDTLIHCRSSIIQSLSQPVYISPNWDPLRSTSRPILPALFLRIHLPASVQAGNTFPKALIESRRSRPQHQPTT